MDNVRKLKLISILKLMGIKSISEVKEIDNTKNVEYGKNKPFELRLRIQKVVFFISHGKLDKDLNYSYPIYIRGPYSEDLSKDYFSISEEEFNNAKKVALEPKVKRLIKYLNKKDNLWLEIASTLYTLIDFGDYEEDEAMDRIMELKHDILEAKNKDYSYVKKVNEELEKMLELYVVFI